MNFFNRGLDPLDLTTGLTGGVQAGLSFAPQEPNNRAGAIASQSMEHAGAIAGVTTGLLAAAGAANAVPIAGQVASAGLAVAAVLTKVFVGRKQRKEAEADRQKQQQQRQAQTSFDQGTPQQGGTGQMIARPGQQSIQRTQPVEMPQAHSTFNQVKQ